MSENSRSTREGEEAPSVRDGIEARVGYAGFVDGTFELIVEGMNGKSVTLTGKLQPGQSERMAEILPTCVMVPVALASAPSPHPDDKTAGMTVEEARRVLDDLSDMLPPEGHIKAMRSAASRVASLAPRRSRSLDARADRIETALLTLQSDRGDQS